jgi:hypothetical protein
MSRQIDVLLERYYDSCCNYSSSTNLTIKKYYSNNLFHTFAPSQRGALNNELRLYPKNLGG